MAVLVTGQCGSPRGVGRGRDGTSPRRPERMLDPLLSKHFGMCVTCGQLFGAGRQHFGSYESRWVRRFRFCAVRT